MPGEQRDHSRGILVLKVCCVKCLESIGLQRSRYKFDDRVSISTICSPSKLELLPLWKCNCKLSPFELFFLTLWNFQGLSAHLRSIVRYQMLMEPGLWRYRSGALVVDEPIHWHWFSRLGDAITEFYQSTVELKSCLNLPSAGNHSCGSSVMRPVITSHGSPLGLSSKSHLNFERGDGRGGSMCLPPRSSWIQGDGILKASSITSWSVVFCFDLYFHVVLLASCVRTFENILSGGWRVSNYLQPRASRLWGFADSASGMQMVLSYGFFIDCHLWGPGPLAATWNSQKSISTWLLVL